MASVVALVVRTAPILPLVRPVLQPSLPAMVPVFRVTADLAVVRELPQAESLSLGLLHQFDFIVAVDGAGLPEQAWRHVQGDGWTGYIRSSQLSAEPFLVPVSRWAALQPE